MSVQSFKKKYITRDGTPGTSSMEFKGKLTFSDDFLDDDNKVLRQVFYELLEDMRFKFLREIDEALAELAKE